MNGDDDVWWIVAGVALTVLLAVYVWFAMN